MNSSRRQRRGFSRVISLLVPLAITLSSLGGAAVAIAEEPSPSPSPTESQTPDPSPSPDPSPDTSPSPDPTTTTDPSPTTDPAPTSEPSPADPAASSAADPVSQPTITSDKADYFAGEQVVLTGAGFWPNEDVNIVVNDDAGQTWRRDVTVTADANGAVTDTFTLPDWFVALYSVRATGLTSGLQAVGSFTDAPKITAKDHEGQRSTGTYTSGNITTYEEGDFINFRFTLTATDAPASGQLQVRFTGDDGDCLFFDGSFSLGTHDSSAAPIVTTSGATPTVTLVGTPVATDFGTSGGEWVQTLNINFGANGEAVVNYFLRLSDEAGECTGSSQHSRLNASGGALSQSGQQNVPVPAGQIIELPEILVTKNIDRDGNGSFEDTADAGEFCFQLDSGSCVPTNASGQVTFTNVTPNGNHTVTEQQLDTSQGTYAFVSGSGTNCTFSGATATATVASGTTSTNATCVFNNGLVTATLEVIKVVENDEAGTLGSSDFTVHVESGGVDVSGSPQAGSSTGTTYTLNPGAYVVSEDVVAGYTGTITGHCASSGAITLAAGDNKTCTITNTDDDVASAGITVTKDATPLSLPEPGGTFTFDVTVTNDSTVDTVTIDTLSDDIYGDLTTASNSDCTVSQVLAPGATYSCSFEGDFTGNAGDDQTDIVTASGTDDDGTPVSDTDDALVTIDDVASAGITVTKDATPLSLPEPGGTFTFDVTVTNDSTVDTVTIDTLSDDIYGDLTTASNSDCTVSQVLAPGATYSCSFEGDFTGNAGDDQTDIVTASGTDDDGTPVSDTDDALVTIDDVASAGITVTKDATPLSLPEPGGTFTFDVTVTNDSTVDTVTIDTLSDDIYGDLTTASNSDCTVSQVLAPGATYSCSFEGDFTGNAGDDQTDIVTASGTDDDGTPVSDTDDALVTIDDVASAGITVTKDATPLSLPEPGGTFTFDVTVTNDSTVDTVTIDTLSDDIYGDLTTASNSDCTVSQVLAPGATYSCSFEGDFTGNAGDDQTDIVTASGTDDDGTPVSDTDDALVTIDDVASAGITVTKDATPLSLPEPGGTFTFDVTVTNDSTVDTVTIDTLSDDIYGDLTTASNSDCTVSQVLAPGATYSCSFEGDFTGNAGDDQTDIVTASGTDDDGDTRVGHRRRSPSRSTTWPRPASRHEGRRPRSRSPSRAAPSPLDVTVTNDSTVDTVTIDTLSDDIYGDLTTASNSDCTRVPGARTRRDLHVLVRGRLHRQRR